MVCAERKDYKDFLGVYLCETWELVKVCVRKCACELCHLQHFMVDTEDLVRVQWSPDDRVLCVIDSPLEYNVMFYSPDGHKLARYSVCLCLSLIRSLSSLSNPSLIPL